MSFGYPLSRFHSEKCGQLKWILGINFMRKPRIEFFVREVCQCSKFPYISVAYANV